MLCGGDAVHWASLIPLFVGACYRVSVFMNSFYCSYKNPPVSLGSAHLLISYCHARLFVLHS
jgi:hypothetical protein